MLRNAVITGFADEIHKDIAVQTALLKELGIQYLEFRSANGKNVADYTLEETKDLKTYLDRKSIKVSAIGSPIGKIRIRDDFEPHFNLFKKVTEIAKIMETPYIRIFSFFIPADEKPDDYRTEVFRRTEQLVNYAKANDVTLLHENEKDIYGDTALRCFNLFEHFYSDHFKCTFDFANFIQCKEDTLYAYELLKPFIEYIHIKDAVLKTGEVVPAGEGDGCVAEILSRLDQNGYDGYLSLEPHLADFAALKTLEKGSFVKKATDGETAFTLAYQALAKIIK